jgi:hypothetical protein
MNETGLITANFSNAVRTRQTYNQRSKALVIMHDIKRYSPSVKSRANFLKNNRFALLRLVETEAGMARARADELELCAMLLRHNLRPADQVLNIINCDKGTVQ